MNGCLPGVPLVHILKWLGGLGAYPEHFKFRRSGLAWEVPFLISSPVVLMLLVQRVTWRTTVKCVQEFSKKHPETWEGVLVLPPNYRSLLNSQRLGLTTCKMGIFIYTPYLMELLQLRYINKRFLLLCLHTKWWGCGWGMLYSYKKRRTNGWMLQYFNSKLQSKSKLLSFL